MLTLKCILMYQSNCNCLTLAMSKCFLSFLLWFWSGKWSGFSKFSCNLCRISKHRHFHPAIRGTPKRGWWYRGPLPPRRRLSRGLRMPGSQTPWRKGTRRTMTKWVSSSISYTYVRNMCNVAISVHENVGHFFYFEGTFVMVTLPLLTMLWPDRVRCGKEREVVRQKLINKIYLIGRINVIWNLELGEIIWMLKSRASLCGK